MNKQNFILTSDENTKNLLISEGFTYVCKEGSHWRFINDGKLNFSDKENKQIIYTNKLNL